MLPERFIIAQSNLGANQTLHLTAIPLRFIAAGELVRSAVTESIHTHKEIF
jgi:hypothetical protein